MRPVLQAADLVLGLGEKDLLSFDLDEKEHRFGADHPLFEDLNHRFARRAVCSYSHEAAEEPEGSSHEQNQGDQGQEHLDEHKAIIARRQIRRGEILDDRFAVRICGIDNFAEKVKKHTLRIANAPFSLIGYLKHERDAV